MAQPHQGSIKAALFWILVLPTGVWHMADAEMSVGKEKQGTEGGGKEEESSL